MLTTTTNINPYAEYQVKSASSTREKSLQNATPTSPDQADKKDTINISQQAKDLQQEFQRNKTSLKSNYLRETQILERDYLKEKSQLEREFSQKKRTLEINIYA